MSTNKRFLRTLLAMAAGLTPALVSAGGYSHYIGARGGVADSRINEAAISAELAARGGHNVRIRANDDSAVGSIYGGVWLTPRMALEVGLLSLGEFDTVVSGTTGPGGVAGLVADLDEVLPTLGGYGLSTTARFDLPLYRTLSFTPRIGAYFWKHDSDVIAAGVRRETSDQGVGFDLALGLTLAVTPKVKANVSWEMLRPSQDGSQKQVVGGLEYRF